MCFLLKEAEICIRNLNCSSKHDILVLEIIFIAIEKKPEDVARVGLLLHNLVKTGLISLESFKQGYYLFLIPLKSVKSFSYGGYLGGSSLSKHEDIISLNLFPNQIYSIFVMLSCRAIYAAEL